MRLLLAVGLRMGLAGYAAYLWHYALFGARKHACHLVTFGFRFAMLLVLYSSVCESQWGLSALPELIATTTESLEGLIAAFPHDLELRFANGTMLASTTESSMDSFHLEVGYGDWVRFTQPMSKPALVEHFRSLYSIASWLEALYQLGAGEGWLRYLVDKRKPESFNKVHHEYRIGEWVSHNHTLVQVAAYFPSNYLGDFHYLVGESDVPVKISHLEPARLKVYFWNSTVARDGVPLDATAVITPTRFALLHDYSFHFNDYWQRTSVTPPSTSSSASSTDEHVATDTTTTSLQCNAPIDPTRWNQAEMCFPIDTPRNKMWFPLDRDVVERDPLVRRLVVLFCDEEHDTLHCSRAVAMRKRSDLQRHYAPLFTPQSHIAWFLVLFAVQTVAVAVVCFVLCAIVIAPASFVVLNVVLLHADDRAIGYFTCLHTSLCAFYWLVIALGLRSQLWPLPLLVNVLALYARRHAKSGAIDRERGELIKRFHRRKPGRAKNPSVVKSLDRTCRICFGGEEEDGGERLVSPCMCDGSMQYVHPDCLHEWRVRAHNTQSFRRCDQCHYPYLVRKTWRERVFRSSLAIFSLSALSLGAVVWLGAAVFKLLEERVWGLVVCELTLGAKACAYVKEGQWGLGKVTNANEAYLVELLATAWGAGVDLGHVVPSMTLLGLAGFFLGDFYTLPWDIGLQEEGLAIFAGGRFAIVTCVGHLRWLWMWWRFWKRRTMLTSGEDGEQRVVSIPRVPWEIPRGTLLKTPFGLARVNRHRGGGAEDGDDVVEMELAGGQGHLLFRSGAESAMHDVEVY